MEPEIEKRINSILSKNRDILKKNYVSGKKSFAASEIFGNGFKPDYYTSRLRHETTNQFYNFCYEYGFGELVNGSYEIIKLEVNRT
jgi:hypothetical protein